MKLLNYTNRALRFVYKDNLTPRGNGRYEVDSADLLEESDYLSVAGQALRVQLRTETSHLSFGLPIVTERILGVDPLPEGDDILIVSKQYAEASRRLCLPTHRLRVVCGGVYTPGVAYPIASTGLAFVEACLPYEMPEIFKTGESDLKGALDYIRTKRLEQDIAIVVEVAPLPPVEEIIYDIEAGRLKPVVSPPATLETIRMLPIDNSEFVKPIRPAVDSNPKKTTLTLRELLKKILR